MNEIDYLFGTGDGAVDAWSSPADLDLASTGIADAVALDFDGDGLRDDALWDSGGNGIADVAALDLDDDGVLDHFYTDPAELGTWDHEITGRPEDAANEQLDWIVRGEPTPAQQTPTPALNSATEEPECAQPLYSSAVDVPGSTGWDELFDSSTALAHRADPSLLDHSARRPFDVTGW